MRRMIISMVAAAAMAVPASVAVVGVATPAWAASSLSCASVKGSVSGSVTIGKCDITKAEKAAYKDAVGTVSALAGGGPVRWTGGATTVTSITSTTSPGQGSCKTGATEEIATGTVTGGNAIVTKVGDAVSVKVCVKAKNGKISIAPGTVALL